MESDDARSEINRLTEKIINCVYRVSNTLGSGFLDSARCMNYLKAAGLKGCLLVNFGRPRVDIKRIVLDC